MFIWEDINLDPSNIWFGNEANRINNFKIIKVKENEGCSQCELLNVSNSEKEIYQGLD